MPPTAAHSNETALDLESLVCRCGGAGDEGRGQRRGGRGARGRRVQRERAHGRGGDAEGIGLARAGVARVPGHAVGLGVDQRFDRRGNSPACGGRAGAGARHGRGPFTGLPETGEFGSIADDLHLYYEDVYSLPGPERIEWARRAEAAALAADPRITNSDGGSFDASTGRKALANSRGFVGGYRTSFADVAAAPLAVDANGKMQRDGWWSSAADARAPRIA